MKSTRTQPRQGNGFVAGAVPWHNWPPESPSVCSCHLRPTTPVETGRKGPARPYPNEQPGVLRQCHVAQRFGPAHASAGRASALGHSWRRPFLLRIVTTREHLMSEPLLALHLSRCVTVTKTTRVLPISLVLKACLKAVSGVSTKSTRREEFLLFANYCQQWRLFTNKTGLDASHSQNAPDMYTDVFSCVKMHSPTTLTKKTAQIQPTWIREHKQTELSQQYSWAQECNCPGRKFKRIQVCAVVIFIASVSPCLHLSPISCPIAHSHVNARPFLLG